MSRKLVRHTVADWFTAAQIQGLDAVHPGKVPEIPWANHGDGGPHSCQAYVLLGRRRETREAAGGLTNGKKDITSSVQLVIWFRSTDTDWLAAQDAQDDITEAIVQQLRSGGRTLGRPDVILMAGEYAAGIQQADEEPVALDGGVLEAVTTIAFEVEEVINS